MTTAAVAQQLPGSLTILYDEDCRLCRRARDWLLTQPCLVEVELMPAGSAEAARRFGTIPSLGNELVVVDDLGNVWAGPSAFLAAMWATARYRSWSFRLARPPFEPFAERFFRWVTKTRRRWDGPLRSDREGCSWCEGGSYGWAAVERCANGHRMPAGANYCRACGAPRADGQGAAARR